MATLYLLGLGVTKDPIKAIHHLNIAAAKNYADAMFELGVLLLGGHEFFKGTILQNKKQGRKWLEEAANLNHPMALELIQRDFNSNTFKKQIRRCLNLILEVPNIQRDTVVDVQPTYCGKKQFDEMNVQFYVENLRLQTLTEKVKLRDGSYATFDELALRLLKDFETADGAFDRETADIVLIGITEYLIQNHMKLKIQQYIESGEILLKRHEDDPLIIKQIKERLHLLKLARQFLQTSNKSDQQHAKWSSNALTLEQLALRDMEDEIIALQATSKTEPIVFDSDDTLTSNIAVDQYQETSNTSIKTKKNTTEKDRKTSAKNVYTIAVGVAIIALIWFTLNLVKRNT